MIESNALTVVLPMTQPWSFNMASPITPAEVIEKRITNFPPEIIEIVNNLIVETFDGRSAVVRAKNVLAAIKKDFSKVHSDKIYDAGWMDFEPIFIKAGWDVKYESPDRDESYEAFYQFIPKRK